MLTVLGLELKHSPVVSLILTRIYELDNCYHFSFVDEKNEAQKYLVQGQDVLGLGDKFQQSDSAASVLTYFFFF